MVNENKPWPYEENKNSSSGQLVDRMCLLIKMTSMVYVCVTDLIGHIIFGTVIQEVKTSNIAREVGILRL